MTEEKRQLLKREISEIMKGKGKERANDIQYIVEYIKEKEGENGFNDLVKELEEYDFKLPDVDKLNSMEWVPRFVPRVFLIGAIRFFDWTQEEVFEMGRRVVASFSSIKFLLKWFPSSKNTITMAINNWNKYSTQGEANLISFDKKNKKCILEVKNFDIQPVITIYYEGIFAKIIEIATGSKKVKIKETENKNEHKYHKFIIKW